jgi:hypothetical protein
MTKQRILLIGTAVIFSLYSNAQRYMPGYVLQNGDTVRGEVDNRNWDVNPTRIQFRTTAAVSNYSLSDIEGFGIFGLDHYRKRFVRVDMNPVDLTQVRKHVRDSVLHSAFFLRVLVDGDQVDLYELQNFKPHYYIEEGGGGTALELNYSVSFDEASGTVNAYNGFHDQLIRLTAGRPDAKELSNQATRLRYQAGEISKFIRSLNSGNGNYTSPDQENTRLKAQFFIGGGLLFGQMKFTGENRELNSLNFPAEKSVVASAGTDIFLSRDHQALFLRAELIVSSFRSKGKGTTKSDGGLNQGFENSYEVKQSSVGPAISLNGGIVRGKSVFVYAGLGYRYNFSNTESKFTSINKLTGQKTVQENFPEPNDNWGNMYLKIGLIAHRRFELATAFFLAGSYIDYGGTTLRSHPVTCQVFYRIGK